MPVRLWPQADAAKVSVFQATPLARGEPPNLMIHAKASCEASAAPHRRRLHAAQLWSPRRARGLAATQSTIDLRTQFDSGSGTLGISSGQGGRPKVQFYATSTGGATTGPTGWGSVCDPPYFFVEIPMGEGSEEHFGALTGRQGGTRGDEPRWGKKWTGGSENNRVPPFGNRRPLGRKGPR